MSEATRDLVRRFFANMNRGMPDKAMFTPDWTVWTLSTRQDGPGHEDLEGNRLLASLFTAGITYEVRSILVDGDGAAARVVAQGTLRTGEEYRNDYVFWFELRDGRIARIEEFYDTAPVTQQLMPLLMKAMGAPKG